MTTHGTKRWLLAAVAAAFVFSYFSPHYNRYYLGVAIDCGIAVIMAVSLNLINGYTGQFSLGHAGFMAVGGFTAAKLTLVTSNTKFPVSLLFGGLMAAIVGLMVGVPHDVPQRIRECYVSVEYHARLLTHKSATLAGEISPGIPGEIW